jgi:CRP/FNR family transcriptional regulator
MSKLAEDELVLVRRVPFLEPLDDETLRELAAASARRRWSKGSRLVTELEPGAEVFIVLSGEAEVSIEARRGEREVLGKLRPGSAFGEMSSLTGDLRSASVVALDDVEALVVPDAAFDDLRERRPEIAALLVRTLAARIADAERSTPSSAPRRSTPEPR